MHMHVYLAKDDTCFVFKSIDKENMGIVSPSITLHYKIINVSNFFSFIIIIIIILIHGLSIAVQQGNAILLIRGTLPALSVDLIS